jgi:hypothetical protein
MDILKITVKLSVIMIMMPHIKSILSSLLAKIWPPLNNLPSHLNNVPEPKNE